MGVTALDIRKRIYYYSSCVPMLVSMLKGLALWQ